MRLGARILLAAVRLGAWVGLLGAGVGLGAGIRLLGPEGRLCASVGLLLGLEGRLRAGAGLLATRGLLAAVRLPFSVGPLGAAPGRLVRLAVHGLLLHIHGAHRAGSP